MEIPVQMYLHRSVFDFTLPGFETAARDMLLNQRPDGNGLTVDPNEIPRLLHTLRLIGGISPRPERVCYVATFGSIDPVLQELFGITEITTTGLWWPGAKTKDEITFRGRDGAQSHKFVHDRFDIESVFPYNDASFDLVVFTEVLEHISRDPMHTLAEIGRITRLGGWLILSTPNCASMRSLLNVLRGNHPYLWSPFSRQGHRDRHNREYTPDEVARLVRCAGYEVDDLHCQNVYEESRSWARRTAAQLLAARGARAFENSEVGGSDKRRAT
jgi:hypothetical protein